MVHPKAALIERLQREGRGKPQFLTQREGPEHEPVYRSAVRIQGREYGRGDGGNKREAERKAAEATLAQLDKAAAAEVAPKEVAKEATADGKRGRRGGGKAAAKAAPATTPAEAPAAHPEQGADLPEGFAGPWPVFERVLAESLRIAHQRVDADLRGDVALAGIEAFALRLYKDVLEDLGEVVEEA